MRPHIMLWIKYIIKLRLIIINNYLKSHIHCQNYLYKIALLFLSMLWQALAVTLHNWESLIKITNFSCVDNILKSSIICSAYINNLCLSCWWALQIMRKCISSSTLLLLQISHLYLGWFELLVVTSCGS